MAIQTYFYIRSIAALNSIKHLEIHLNSQNCGFMAKVTCFFPPELNLRNVLVRNSSQIVYSNYKVFFVLGLNRSRVYNKYLKKKNFFF